MTDVLTEMRNANPAPAGSDPHPTSWSYAALLAEIDKRSGIDMTFDQKTRPERVKSPESPRRRTGFAVAAAAFVAIMLVIGVAAVVPSRDDDTVDQPAATTLDQPTTTTAPPSTTTATEANSAAQQSLPSDEDQALINSFVAAYNTGNVDSIMSFIAPTTLYWDYENRTGIKPAEPPQASSYGESLSLTLQFGALLQRSYSFEECSQFQNGQIMCSGSISDAVAAPTVGAIPTRMFFSIADGGFSLLTIEMDPGTYLFAWGEFFDWLNEAHPDDMTTLEWSGSLPAPKYTEETLPLWEQRVADYAATVEG